MTVTALNKNFDALQNDYKQWKQELQQMNQRISNIEKAINISPPLPPPAATKNVAISSQHPSKQQKTPAHQQQHESPNQHPPKPSSASSSPNTNDNNSSIANSRMS